MAEKTERGDGPAHVLTDKYGGVPGYGWVAIVGVGAGAGWILIRRLRGKSSSAATVLPAGAASSPADTGFGGGGSGGGSAGGGNPGTQPIGGGSVSIQPVPDAAPAPAPAFTPSPLSFGLPDKYVAPIGAVLSGGGNVTNPVGYTQSEASNPNNSYTPSYLDMLTERPQGVNFSLVAPAGNPSQYATVYTNVPAPTGGAAGKIIDATNRVAGERYADIGGGKLQVIN